MTDNLKNKQKPELNEPVTFDLEVASMSLGITCAASEAVQAHDKLIQAKDALDEVSKADAINLAREAHEILDRAASTLRRIIKRGAIE